MSDWRAAAQARLDEQEKEARERKAAAVARRAQAAAASNNTFKRSSGLRRGGGSSSAEVEAEPVMGNWRQAAAARLDQQETKQKERKAEIQARRAAAQEAQDEASPRSAGRFGGGGGRGGGESEGGGLRPNVRVDAAPSSWSPTANSTSNFVAPAGGANAENVSYRQNALLGSLGQTAASASASAPSKKKLRPKRRDPAAMAAKASVAAESRPPPPVDVSHIEDKGDRARERRSRFAAALRAGRSDEPADDAGEGKAADTEYEGEGEDGDWDESDAVPRETEEERLQMLQEGDDSDARAGRLHRLAQASANRMRSSLERAEEAYSGEEAGTFGLTIGSGGESTGAMLTTSDIDTTSFTMGKDLQAEREAILDLMSDISKRIDDAKELSIERILEGQNLGLIPVD